MRSVFESGSKNATATDSTTVTATATDSTTVYTKRQVLSMVAQIFDSTGLVTPYVLIPKLILQRSWKLILVWDEP